MKSDKAPTISALSYEGLTAVTADGRPAQFALIDEDGKVIAAGEDIAQAAWATSIQAYRKFLMGQGHMRVITKAEALALQGSLTIRLPDAPNSTSQPGWPANRRRICAGRR